MPIRLYQFDNYIEIMNAGGLYGEARPENFPFVNAYRNLLVAEAMRIGKYVNKFNRGIARVQEMLKENGNAAADFDANTITAFRVTVLASEDTEATSQPTSRAAEATSQPAKATSRPGEANLAGEAQYIDDLIVEFCKEPHSLAELTKYWRFGKACPE